MEIHGSCHCGAITYVADIDPARVTICHCTDCQRLTGSAYRVTVPVAIEAFHLLSGTATTYVKVADSGARRVQAFCGTCGAPMFAHALDAPTTYGLRIGSIAERGQLLPRRQIWCQSALDWSADLSGVPRSPRE